MGLSDGQRRRRVLGRLLVACAALLLVVALAAVAAGKTRPAGIERSYGKDGIVKVSDSFALEKGAFVSVHSFGAAKGGAAYAVGSVYPCSSAHCREGAFLMRFAADGSRDESYGDEGGVFLHGQDTEPAVIADGAGRAVVFEVDKGTLVLRRFTGDGDPDRAFGAGGAVKIPCRCAEAESRLLEMSGGRLMVVVGQSVRNKKTGYGSVATRVRLVQLLPDGARDKRFGRSGEVDFKLPRPGGIGAVARTADDAILFGGVGWEERPHHAWLWRITASGRADRRFDRDAARSLRRLGPLGGFPGLVSIVPRPDGTFAAVGTIQEHLGFVLRLRRDGTLATGFGKRGLTELPANVEGAVGGVDGAVFVVGEGRRSRLYSAYRILGGGGLDPAYHGSRGVKVPLPGEGIGVESQGGGRALVTNIGYYECREGCPPEPGMVRFRE